MDGQSMDQSERRDFGDSSLVTIGSEIEIGENDQKNINIQETSPFFDLPSFQAMMFATILEEVIFAFRVLAECNNSTRRARIINDMSRRLQKKYGILPANSAAADPDVTKSLGCDENKINKIYNDRTYVTDAIVSTYFNLTRAQTFKHLWNKCYEVLDHECYEEYLKNNQILNKTIARNLYKQLRQLRIQRKSAEYESDNLCVNYRKQIEDIEQMACVVERYSHNWQKAGKEQCLESVNLEQESFQSSITRYKTRTEQESVIHGDVDMIYMIMINETTQKLETIMKKYEKDMEEIELRIQIKRSKVEEITDTNKKLDEKLKRRDHDMKSWKQYKTERANQLQYQKDMHRSACVVQAWWRGLLVRIAAQKEREMKMAASKKKKIPAKTIKK